MSKDFLDRDLPKPELSWDEEDFPEELSRESSLSCLGGASFRMFTTLSTIFVPIKTGFTSSLLFECPRLLESTIFPVSNVPPSLIRPREGEQDFCRGLPVLMLLEEN